MHGGLSRVKKRNAPYRKNIAMNVFLLIMGYVNQFSKHFMPSVCTYGLHVRRKEFLNHKFYSDKIIIIILLVIPSICLLFTIKIMVLSHILYL